MRFDLLDSGFESFIVYETVFFKALEKQGNAVIERLDFLTEFFL